MPSDLRKTCDMDDRHGKPVDQRWSKEWRFYFHLCGKCLKQWDATHDEGGGVKEHDENHLPASH